MTKTRHHKRGTAGKFDMAAWVKVAQKELKKAQTKKKPKKKTSKKANKKIRRPTKKWLNAQPQYVSGDSNWDVYKMGLGPNSWHYKKITKTKKKAKKKVKTKVKKKSKATPNCDSVRKNNKYNEEWACEKNTYSKSIPSTLNLKVRRKRIDEIYKIHKAFKKLYPKAVSPDKWEPSPKKCTNEQLQTALKTVKKEFKFIEDHQGNI
jgi:hypothetical protein